jgi:hypothetical protein
MTSDDDALRAAEARMVAAWAAMEATGVVWDDGEEYPGMDAYLAARDEVVDIHLRRLLDEPDTGTGDGYTGG